MTSSLETTTTTLRQALRDHGVSAIESERLASTATPDLIGAWCEHKSRHPNMGPGALVTSIRHGAPPPVSGRSQVRTEQERAYSQKVTDWLRANFPEVCDERGEPHWAAVRTVIRMHHRYGRGSLTVTEHGQAIRGAVADAKAEALETGR